VVVLKKSSSFWGPQVGAGGYLQVNNNKENGKTKPRAYIYYNRHCTALSSY
jgi:hypothetical protein